MNKKIISAIMMLLIIAGSFGSLGLRTKKTLETDCNCENSEDIDYKNLCGLEIPDRWWETADFDSNNNILQTGNSPDFYDLRRENPENRNSEFINVLPDIRNQGGCGSCWAFATVGALEFNIAREENQEVDLSEQWLISCNNDGWGCGGGWWAHSYHEWKKGKCGGKGAVLDSDFPNQYSDDINWKDWADSNDEFRHYYLIDEWHYIGLSVYPYGIPSVSDIKQYMLNYGPICASIYAGDEFHDYNGGLFDENEVPDDWPGQEWLDPTNHAILLVGWDDDYQGTGTGVWILRNSWGTGWGDDGYMYIKYGTSKVGYAANYIKYTGLGNGDKTVEFEINKLTNNPSNGDYEQIDHWVPPNSQEPEWYYEIYIGNDYDDRIYNRYNKNIGYNFVKSDWFNEYTWDVNQIHRFQVDEHIVNIYLKLMDHDGIIEGGYDDLADVCADSGGGKDDNCPDKPGAIYHAIYNLATDTLTGDETLASGDWITTEGTYSEAVETNNAKVWFNISDNYDPEPDLSCSGSLSWSDVNPGSAVTGSFTVSNIGEEGSLLDWEIDSYPNWGSFSFDPNQGNGLKPSDGSFTVDVTVTAPDDFGNFNGNIVVVNEDDNSDKDSISVSLSTRDPVADLECKGSLSWSNVVVGEEVTGTFTVENVGDPGSELDWYINSLPDLDGEIGNEWNYWAPSEGFGLTPEDDPVTVEVSVTIPRKFSNRDRSFSGDIVVKNHDDILDGDSVPVSLTTSLPKSKSSLNFPSSLFFEFLKIFNINNIFMEIFI